MKKESSANSSFFALLDAAVDGIIIIDKQGIIQTVNAAVTEMFSYSVDELVGENVSILMSKENRQNHDGYIRRYLDTAERKIIGIGRVAEGRRKDQSCFPVHLSVGQIEDEGDSEGGFVGVIRDLTVQRSKEQEVARKESEIRQLRERLIHVARISTLGEMVTGIAHEVNQPLTAIATYAQGCTRMINAGLKEPEELLLALDKISIQAQRAARVIAGVRQFSKKSPMQQQAYDCNKLISEVAALAEIHAAELGVSIELQLPGMQEHRKLMVMVDATQVQQVALNLINNAIESMANTKGEKIVTIRTRELDTSRIEVSVSDLGEGLDSGLEDKIFDTFFSTKRSGLGMGLSICQSLVKAQGGEIYFHANSGSGCSFCFTLPTVLGK